MVPRRRRCMSGSQRHCEHVFLLCVVTSCMWGPGLKHNRTGQPITLHSTPTARRTLVCSSWPHSYAQPVSARGSICTPHSCNRTDRLSIGGFRGLTSTYKALLLVFGAHMAAAILDVVDNVVAHDKRQCRTDFKVGG